MNHLQRTLYDTPRDCNKLWLNANECNCRETRSLIKKIFSEVDYNRLSTYPALYKIYVKLATILDTKSSYLLLTQGADGAIRQFFEHNRGSRALLMRPTFEMNDVYAHYYCEGIEYIDYTSLDRDTNDITFIMDGLSKMDRGDIFVLASPDSPIGVQYTKEQLWTIADICRMKGMKLLVDETYILFGNREHSMIPYIDDTMSVCHSFSKSLGLAGVRIGYLVCKDESIKDNKHMKDLGDLQGSILDRVLDNMPTFLSLIDKQIELRNEICTHNGWHNAYGNYVHADTNIIDIDKLEKIAYIRRIPHSVMDNRVRVTLPDKSCIQSILN